tara:strand:- start:44944 stop:45801 length:858 start_codon:yes stop_codon:yes gene_type:complete
MINQEVLLKNETTYRFGGMCKNFFLLEHKKDLENFNEYDIFDEYFILGKGSNIAFSENEFNGAVIQSKINYINFDNNTNKLELGSGTYLPDLSRFLKSKNLSNGEFLLGIPGTVGGALSMNAGCYGYEFLDYVESFEYFDIKSKKIQTIKKSQINYGYRFTDIDDSIVLSVTMIFPDGDPDIISNNMKEFTNHRRNTQPSALYNAGSVFKNGDDYYAAELIENAGLKGYKIDGVRVSEKHSNFFIADKDAKSSALYKLVNFVKESIFEKYDVRLQEEIIFVGDFS